MRHLLGGVAIAALIAAGLPAMAQTSSTKQPSSAPSATNQNMPQSGATMPSDTGEQPKAGKHAGKHQGMQSTAQRRSRGSSEDNMAEELNRQELQRVQQGAATQGSGTTQGTMPQSTMPSTAAPRQ